MLTLLPTPIGNLEDITFRALRALEQCSVVLCEDTRVAKRLLQLLAQKFSLEFGQKRFISLHEHNQNAFLAKLEPSFFSQDVVYMSDAGMPGISDPGAKLVAYAQEHNIPYTVLPGPSAFVTAYVASGFGQKEFCFYGFLPHKGQERSQSLQKILQNSHNVILYEAPHRLLKLLEEITQIDPSRDLFLAKELTKIHEKFYKGEAKDLFEQLKNENIKGEWVVVVRASQQKQEQLCLGVEDLLALSLPKKELAKLLAKVSEKSVKEWYSILTKS
ncbi:16S rRNA (cytidine(1402)-2'-O)-methyltransferase [Nitratiruptor sp. YY09-18]|uniref:16S rRNA (cytidine(1402)-2'-O)-methyltransferase n=1 Tax=Nitratiruptor sp. YY09-18 TaxID=2724901 RepID=UPI0019160EE9|nr:16S rRNA (cytidine(1402)-2'-O)-methyltransferase [Nitratiruptor sp. YY09-18]BCD68664.1 16S rRNA (cytidine1402-2'-O)-methyltransferase [Nitratiruptor sp. YY09-18]